MTVAILLVSVSSLVVAIVHSKTPERMADANARLVEANSWPFLSYYTGTTQSGRTVTMPMVNDGVGPAKIAAIEVRWQRRPRRDALEFLAPAARLCRRRPILDTNSLPVAFWEPVNPLIY